MEPVLYHSTSSPEGQRVTFGEALLGGLAPDGGLYMMRKDDIPQLSAGQIAGMRDASYAQIAFQVLNPLLGADIPSDKLEALLTDAYPVDMNPKMQEVDELTHIMWLTTGPTYSFKDYAARFYGRALNHFLEQKDERRVVVVATSGDTGGAVADALQGLDRVDNVVFFPRGEISEGQRRQMTTLGNNIYAFEVSGDFDVCQALAKYLLSDKEFAQEVFGDRDRLTSANSISVGRLLPQGVYPFFAYSRVAQDGQPIIASIPSGNFGDLMGTMIAREMGLPIEEVVCGVNGNTVFARFMQTGEYRIQPTKNSYSSAMNVSHPSNLARLIDLFGGRMVDVRDPRTREIIRRGVLRKLPDTKEMKQVISPFGVPNAEHLATIRKVFKDYSVILDPHGSVGWSALEQFRTDGDDRVAVVYETADPGKFPDVIQLALKKTPEIPLGIQRQAALEERIYSIDNGPDKTQEGLRLNQSQIQEAKEKIAELFS